MDLLWILALRGNADFCIVPYWLSIVPFQDFAKSRRPHLVNVLNREEATHVLKEIITGCNLSADAVMLMPPNSDSVLSKGYQLHIKSSTQPNDLLCIKTIIETHRLAITTEPDNEIIVIYRPPSE